jgi:CubicO group peptidase (beta-lactamase class C family)
LCEYQKCSNWYSLIFKKSSEEFFIALFICYNQIVYYPLLRGEYMDSRFAQVDAIFAPWDKTQSPGCALAIIQNGEILYSRGYGMANLEHGIPNQEKTVFYLASVSKQFTAMCAALLAEEGLVSLDDDVRKYIPELPQYQAPITIRHLVHHTSGLRDYLELMSLAGGDSDDVLTMDEALASVVRQRELNFTPGDRYLYCNSGYLLLSFIVQRTSGLTIRQYAQKKIFDPLGMKDSHFHDERNEIVPRRATGYMPGPDGRLRIDAPHFDVIGSGGIYSTIGDLFKWDQNFYHNQIGKGSPDLINLVQTPWKLNNGEKMNYAFGLMVEPYRGLKRVEHDGAYGGYRTVITRFPEQSFSVIILSNLGTIAPEALACKVADIFLAGQFTGEPAKTDWKEVTISAEALAEKAGTYLSAESEMVVDLLVKEGRMWLKIMGIELPLSAQDENTFHLANAPVEGKIMFEKPRADAPQKLGFELAGGKLESMQRIEVITPAESDLCNMAGEYYSDELQARIKLIIQDGKPVIKDRRHTLPFRFGKEDMFVGDTVNFYARRSESGSVSELQICSGRARNISFKRI